jgi:hypothetical protein
LLARRRKTKELPFSEEKCMTMHDYMKRDKEKEDELAA